MKSGPTRYSGLLPHKGWPKRNFRFLRHRIVPGMFRQVNGNVLEPVLAPPDLDKVRITWIGHASFCERRDDRAGCQAAGAGGLAQVGQA